MKKVKLLDRAVPYSMGDEDLSLPVEVSPVHEIECNCGERTRFHVRDGYTYSRIEAETLRDHIKKQDEMIKDFSKWVSEKTLGAVSIEMYRADFFSGLKKRIDDEQST